MQENANPSLLQIESKKVLANKSRSGSPCVLIIDDDMDAILPIECGFRLAGFSTHCAISIHDACQKMVSHPPDLIILDWMLDYGCGSDLIRDCLRKVVSRFCPTHQIPVITHSGLDASAINISDNPIFRHVGHWKKPMNFQRVVEAARALLTHPLVQPIEAPLG